MPLKSLKELIVKPLLNNMVAALMALAMALALWVFAYNFSYAPPAMFSVPVRVPASQGWAVSMDGNDRQTVDVEIKYPRRFQSQVEQLFRTDGAVYAQVRPGDALNEAGDDAQDIKVTLKEADLVVSRALGINVIQFHPSNITLHYVREMRKSLEVLPLKTDPPADYQVAYVPYCTPRTVTVRGPKNIISGATGIETELIDISAPVPGPNLPEWTVTATARLVPYVTVGNQRYPVTLSEETVQCRITLVRASIERTFENVPIMLLEPPDYPYVASLREGESATSVRVRGPASIVNSLKPENIVLYVDVRGLKPIELYHTEPIEAEIVGVPNAGQLTITLGSPDRAVKVAEPNPPK